MKKLTGILVVAVLLGGCLFDFPVTEEHDIPVDPGLLGVWEIAPGQDNEETEWLVVLEFSPTEYVIDYFGDSGAIYFRAYGIDIDGIEAVQLEVLGDEKGPPKDKWNRFHIIRASVEDEQLTIETINEHLVGADSASSEDLHEVIVLHKGNEELFGEPMFFIRK